MRSNYRYSRFTILLAFALLTTGCGLVDLTSVEAKEPEFNPSSSRDTVRDQIDKLPTDDVWWNVYGEDQAWNFKNLHRFMPIVNVYRQGQVRLLRERPLPRIANQLVDTPRGSMGFKTFLDSDEDRKSVV